MIFCILELLLLIWDILLVVYHFVTGKVSFTIALLSTKDKNEESEGV